jgi:transcriptional regulator GlxA family with amidase domain
VIVIPVYEGVDVLDVAGPFEMFRWADIKVCLAAQTAGRITCNGGLVLEVDTTFADAPAGDVLWTPGGDPKALVRLMSDPSGSFLDFLVTQSKAARYVASVCEGALLLAAAGLLDGYAVTTHWAFIPCLLQRFPGVTVVDGHPRFHLDRNRLTGGGISSGLDAALELIRLLNGEAVAQHVQQKTQYYPDPPVTSEIPATISCPLDEVAGELPAAVSAFRRR